MSNCYKLNIIIDTVVTLKRKEVSSKFTKTSSYNEQSCYDCFNIKKVEECSMPI